VSGTKGELVDRVVDGQMYGALPRCPQCGGGILRVTYPSNFGHNGQGNVKCPGYFDDTDYVNCSYRPTAVQRESWKFS